MANTKDIINFNYIMKKIKVGVIGGAGYTAGELLRILMNHPNVEISFVNSSSNAGNPITEVHSGLIGETDLVFTSELPLTEVDALFLCSAHGDSKKFMEANEIPASIKIIDLSKKLMIHFGFYSQERESPKSTNGI